MFICRARPDPSGRPLLRKSDCKPTLLQSSRTPQKGEVRAAELSSWSQPLTAIRSPVGRPLHMARTCGPKHGPCLCPRHVSRSRRARLVRRRMNSNLGCQAMRRPCRYATASTTMSSTADQWYKDRGPERGSSPEGSRMKNLNARHAFVSLVVAAGLIGIAFMGIAFGHSLRLGDLSMLSQHRLFNTGAQSLTTAVVCWLLLSGLGRSSKK